MSIIRDVIANNAQSIADKVTLYNASNNIINDHKSSTDYEERIKERFGNKGLRAGYINAFWKVMTQLNDSSALPSKLLNLNMLNHNDQSCKMILIVPPMDLNISKVTFPFPSLAIKACGMNMTIPMEEESLYTVFAIMMSKLLPIY